MVRFSGGAADFTDRAQDASGAAVATGVVGGIVLLTLGEMLPHNGLGGGLMALGLVLPLLLTQDCLRFVSFAARRGSVALAADLAWFTTAMMSLGIALVLGADEVWVYVLAWGGSTIPAIVLACARLGVLPRPSSSGAWWRRQRDLAWRYVGEFTALNGASQLALYAIGWIAGLSAAGAVRGAQILMGPVAALFLGVSLYALPEGVRRTKQGVAQVLSLSRSLSVVLGALALVWISVLMLFREQIGDALLGESSAEAMTALPGVALAMAATGVTFGAFIGLRAYAAARRSLRVRVIVAPLVLAGASIGALKDGASGGAFGLAIAGWIGVCLWWWEFRAEMEARRTRTTALPDVSGRVAS